MFCRLEHTRKEKKRRLFKMEVTESNLDRVINHLKEKSVISLDTETTGLRPYHGDVLFSIILSCDEKDFYFNFNSYGNKEPLPATVFFRLKELLAIPHLVVVFHNAKFDLAFLRKEGIEVKSQIVDIWTLSRLNYNDHFTYSLSDIGKRLGYPKSNVVEEYITEHKLWEWVDLTSLNKRYKDKRYNEVPFEIVKEYGERDGRVTYECYKKLKEAIDFKDRSTPSNLPKLQAVVSNEAELSKTLFEMEHTGVKVDISYCKSAVSYYEEEIEKIKKEFKVITGFNFVKGTNLFKEIFKEETWIYTEKKNPKFDMAALKTFKHPAAKLVIDYSEAKKQLEYFHGFLYHMDDDGLIHTNFKQAGTATGRLSSSEPNLQNLTKPDKYETDEEELSEGKKMFPVRRAFVPRDGYFFVMLDFDQMEYRMMLDIAKANGLIDKVKGGLDVHQATADVAGITRQQAKTVNFAILYGSGIKALSESLGTSIERAKEIRSSIFRAAPEIRTLIRGITRTAERRGYIFNWAGRRSHFPNTRFSYKAPNYLIQGGTADVVKKAMNICHDYLKKYKTKMVLTIHDELVFEVAYGEEFVVGRLKELMEGIYPHKRLPLTCGIDYSTKSLADKLPWGDLFGSEARDNIQGKSSSEAGLSAKHLGSQNTANDYQGHT